MLQILYMAEPDAQGPHVLAAVQHAVNDSQPKSVKGTIAYLAPEVVLCNFNKAK